MTQEMASNKTNKRLLLGAGAAVVVAFLAWLAFGFFGIQAAFIDDEVDEAGPVFASGAIVDQDAADQDVVVATEEFTEAMEEAEANPVETTEDMMPGEITTLASGEFSGESRYTITGTANVLNDGTDQRFLRFENFDSSNGPDLKVYLRAESGEFVSLGDLKGNIGDQNYEIPTDVDISEFSTVQIWCERFGVNFGFAELA